jgi:hypothetical protein
LEPSWTSRVRPERAPSYLFGWMLLRVTQKEKSEMAEAIHSVQK